MAYRKLFRESGRMCDYTSGNTTVNVIDTTAGIAIGDSVRGPGIPAAATVSAVAATTVTLSAAPTASNTERLYFSGALANAGSTGNNTHASVRVDGLDPETSLSLQFRVTAVGATPTVSWLFQGSDEDPVTPDASSNWYALSVLPSDANAETAAVQTKTAVGVYDSELELARRPTRKIRLVTSANTNVTYAADIFAFKG